MKWLAFFLLVFFCASCGDNKPDDETAPDGTLYVTFTEREIATDFSGVQKRIEVSSNCDWSVSAVPEWCVARKVVEENKEYLEVEVRINDEEVPRRGVIVVSSNELTFNLPVAQGGRGSVSVDALQWYTFPMNFFTSIKFQVLQGKEARNYQIAASRLFVTPSFRKQVFTGNLINRVTDQVKLIDYYDKYTFNPITISSLNGTVKELPKPSFEGMDELVQQIIADLPEQSLEYYNSSPVQYNSYRHLHLLGVGNMGISLDELINGKPYSEQKMEKKTGMLYTYSQELFSVIMDYPVNGKLIEETIDKENIAYMSYINSVYYGKTALLLVESDYTFNAVKSVVSLIMGNESLNDEQAQIEKSLDVRYVYFDKEGVYSVKGGNELIKRYVYESKSVSKGIIPLSFTTNKLEDLSVGSMEIGFELK